MTGSHERRPYIRVALLIRGGDDPAEITRILGMEPDESYRRGAPIPIPPDAKYKVKKTRVYAASIWKLNSRLKQYSYNVEDYVNDLLYRLRRVDEKISSLDRRRFNVTMDVSLDLLTDAATAAAGLSIDTMAALTRLGASFDVDTYVWNDLPPYAEEGLSRFS
ncbi:MAG: DUF4279 domain-containing protein [Elusimicrobia bacterium]|nr:DUF4279 domain-containing protein [Elusimicrobiota bacterium]